MPSAILLHRHRRPRRQHHRLGARAIRLPLFQFPIYTIYTITKLAIFHYVYAVLHHPTYRAKYERNLNRELPRIPFYDDFWQWAAWGEQLMALHLEYQQVTPYPLAHEDVDPRGFAETLWV